MATISPSHFQALLARAKKLAQSKTETASTVAPEIDKLSTLVTDKKPEAVDMSKMGITSDTLETPEGQEAAVEAIQEIVSIPQVSRHKTGVAADVTLNDKQNEFVNRVLDGEDICLIGAAGTGKTTATGKAIRKLVDSGKIGKLGANTKVLFENVPGIMITSFTRKAVNNIRRAVPDELKPHVITMHKALEFAPVFYEIYDEKTDTYKNTMRFEPQRTPTNPLPSGLKLVIYEETSMIGTDLYNLMAKAMPHNPQEIFLGDICQLPPIFGPAILGFKMSLLPVVQLTEVYRQALLSPIIRLAHAVLSGDSSKFSPKIEVREEIHPALGKKVKRNRVPSLEKFNEKSEHGSVDITVWQKRLTNEAGLNTTVLQFNHWIETGYYDHDEDIILCPFNKSFGTVELNKGIQNYLGKKRDATVYEVIAGFEKHYFAVGDRVLYDKEDAVITAIRRNGDYFGKHPQPAHKQLDRWGILQEQLSEEELKRIEAEETEFSMAALDKFMGADDEEGGDRVNSASHVITIRFKYTEEEITLSSAGEINNLLGGNALTIHKMQGSEAETVFLVLHHSHAAMISNELLYTAITRARSKLHIICEPDTFYKGVKSHKVRGVTLAEKMEFFKGKVEFKEMQEEMEFLTAQRDGKEAIRQFEKSKKLELVVDNSKEKDEEKAELDAIMARVFDKLNTVSAPKKSDTIQTETKVLDDTLDTCLGGITEELRSSNYSASEKDLWNGPEIIDYTELVANGHSKLFLLPKKATEAPEVTKSVPQPKQELTPLQRLRLMQSQKGRR